MKCDYCDAEAIGHGSGLFGEKAFCQKHIGNALGTGKELAETIKAELAATKGEGETDG